MMEYEYESSSWQERVGGRRERTYQISDEDLRPKGVEEVRMAQSIRSVRGRWEDDGLSIFGVELGKRFGIGRDESCVSAIVL